MAGEAEDSDEWIEEDTLVVAELSGLIDGDTLKKSNLKCHVLGIDTENPVLQLDNYLFSGHYEDSIGTDLIFRTVPTDPSNLNSEVKGIEYHCMATKRLVMQRTFLQNKNIPEASAQSEALSEDAGDVDDEASEPREEESDGAEDDPPVGGVEPFPSTSGAQIIHSKSSKGT